MSAYVLFREMGFVPSADEAWIALFRRAERRVNGDKLSREQVATFLSLRHHNVQPEIAKMIIDKMPRNFERMLGRENIHFDPNRPHTFLHPDYADRSFPSRYQWWFKEIVDTVRVYQFGYDYADRAERDTQRRDIAAALAAIDGIELLLASLTLLTMYHLYYTISIDRPHALRGKLYFPRWERLRVTLADELADKIKCTLGVADMRSLVGPKDICYPLMRVQMFIIDGPDGPLLDSSCIMNGRNCQHCYESFSPQTEESLRAHYRDPGLEFVYL